MMTVVENIPTFLHVAVGLFISGLIQFLFPINQIVFYFVAGISGLLLLLYIVMTVLQNFWAECPYRTPFSVRICSPCTRRRITREDKAQDLSSEASKRRIKKDLCWTLDSLKTDSELEPFVAGLPTLLSVPAGQKGSQETLNAMIAILGNHGLTYRIARLLHTCIPPTTLSDDLRIKRATICLKAVSAICSVEKIGINQSIQLIRHLGNGQFSAALLGFGKSHLSSEVKTIGTLIAKKIEQGATVKENKMVQIPLSVVIAISEILERFELLKRVDSKGEFASSLLDEFSDIFTLYSKENGEPSAQKQMWVQEFSKRIIEAQVGQAPWLPTRRLDVIQSLVKFRAKGHPAMTQRANCASAFLAIQMQHYVLGYSIPYYMPNAVKALIEFGTVLSGDTLGVQIINELCLGIQLKDNKSGIVQSGWEEQNKWKPFRGKQMKAFGKVPPGSAEDRGRLENLVIKDENGKPVEEEGEPVKEEGEPVKEKGKPVTKGYWGRVLISRGRTAILVIFLSSMKDSLPPKDTFDLTLETLKIITSGLTAAYSSSSTQTLLIDLVGKVSGVLHTDPMQQGRSSDPSQDQGARNEEEEGDVIQEIPVGVADAGGASASISNTTEQSPNTANYIPPMLQVLLDVIGTIAHPDSIEKAKGVVTTIKENFSIVHTDADRALAKVRSFLLCSGTTESE